MDQSVYQMHYDTYLQDSADPGLSLAQGPLPACQLQTRQTYTKDSEFSKTLFKSDTASDPAVLSIIYKKCSGTDHFLSFLQKGNRHDEI